MLHFYGNEPLGGSNYDVRMIDSVVENAVSGVRTCRAAAQQVSPLLVRMRGDTFTLTGPCGPWNAH